MEPSSPTEYLFVVRRGCEDKLEFLKSTFVDRTRVRVILDRRQGERRRARMGVPVDRRKADRRGPPPPSWDLADYVLVLPRTP
jgi:hypothetical protein